MNSCLYEGTVRHRRMGALSDEFCYSMFMVYLDLDELPELFDGRWLWSARRPALAWFRRADYLGDPAMALPDAVRELVLTRTGTRPAGPIRLLTHLRYFGHCFNPVSFYYCFDASDEHVIAVVADVTNTPWGEHHAYVMPVAETDDHGTVALMRAQLDKQLHVSPLMSMDHVYDWRLTVPGESLIVHIEALRTDARQPDRQSARQSGRRREFDATLSLRRTELSSGTLRRMLLRYPFLTARILARIYGHALRLRLRGARWYPHPRGRALST